MQALCTSTWPSAATPDSAEEADEWTLIEANGPSLFGPDTLERCWKAGEPMTPAATRARPNTRRSSFIMGAGGEASRAGT